MPRHRPLPLLGVAVILTCTSLLAGARHGAAQSVTIRQQGAPPSPIARDSFPTLSGGTAAVKGRVVDGATGTPIPRARVRVTGPGGMRPFVLTDANGAFAVTGLPAGSFNVMAEKSTYMQGTYPDRGRSLRAGAMRPLLLQNGQTIDNVTVSLHRGGAIVGRVLDAFGDPLEYAQVTVLRSSGLGGTRPGIRSSSQTNDLGEFRVSRLEPGHYVLMVAMQRRGPDDGAQDPKAAAPPQPLPTFYPSALSAAEAQPITVERGQTVSGIEVTMTEGTPTIVTGTVIGSDGQAAPGGGRNGGFINTRMVGKDFSGAFIGGGGGPIRPDGTFRMTLPPGEYLFEAHFNPAPGTQPRPDQQQVGMTRVVVSGEAMNVSIVIGQGATASGRVIFEGATAAPPPPANARAPLFSSDVSCRSGQMQIAADWTFKLEGLNGICSAPPTPSFGRWAVKSVTMDGRDLMSEPFAFVPGQHYGGVQVTVTDRRAELTLQVSDERGEMTREFVGIIYPVEKSRWADVGPMIRTFVPPPAEVLEQMQAAMKQRGASADAYERLKRGSLPMPPGEYYVIAVDDIDGDSARDPAVLERLSSSAMRVFVSEGNSEVQLRRVKLADVVR